MIDLAGISMQITHDLGTGVRLLQRAEPIVNRFVVPPHTTWKVIAARPDRIPPSNRVIVGAFEGVDPFNDGSVVAWRIQISEYLEASVVAKGEDSGMRRSGSMPCPKPPSLFWEALSWVKTSEIGPEAKW